MVMAAGDLDADRGGDEVGGAPPGSLPPNARRRTRACAPSYLLAGYSCALAVTDACACMVFACMAFVS